MKADGEGEWSARKHGGPKKRLWRKLHLGMDEETLEIRAVGVTTSNVGDAPLRPDLLDQIPPDQEIAMVTADGASDARRCHNVIAARGAAAIIPPRKNAKRWKPTTAGAVARNEAVRACKYLGRGLWRNLTDYHRQSRAQTKVNCVKLGQTPGPNSWAKASWPETSTDTSLSSRSGSHRYTALGIPVTESGKCDLHPMCATIPIDAPSIKAHRMASRLGT